MAKLLRVSGLTLEGGVLAKAKGLSDTWNTHAIFEVSDPSKWTIRVKDLEPIDTGNNVWLPGIVPASSKINVSDIEMKKGMTFLDLGLRKMFVGASLGSATPSSEWPQPSDPHGREVEITYIAGDSGGDLYVAEDGSDRVKIVGGIPPGDYRPCITVGLPGSRIRVSISTPSTKRSSETGNVSCKMGKSMWGDTQFADAKVVCGKMSFPVHRIVLATNSQFFANAFKGEMREAKECVVNIPDATEEGVEALLKFLYTQTVPVGADIVDLLPLAHRYEAAGLVELCMEEMETSISRSNVAKFVSVLRPLREDSSVKSGWQKLHQLIAADPDYVEALMIGVVETI